MSRASRTLAAAALLVIALAPAAAGQANAASSAPSSTAAPSPTPTLGSNTPAPNPPGSANSSPRDYKGASWVVGAVLLVAAIVGGGTFYLTRTHRIDLTQLSPPEESDTQQSQDVHPQREPQPQDGEPQQEQRARGAQHPHDV
ncbi:hypothetical protein [Kribbella karoonensis]|uniref:hypothetical protein n=1 Tax=Kribbella karoonensis TaxID=324851 RepID=UPI002F65C4D7